MALAAANLLFRTLPENPPRAVRATQGSARVAVVFAAGQRWEAVRGREGDSGYLLRFGRQEVGRGRHRRLVLRLARQEAYRLRKKKAGESVVAQGWRGSSGSR